MPVYRLFGNELKQGKEGAIFPLCLDRLSFFCYNIDKSEYLIESDGGTGPMKSGSLLKSKVLNPEEKNPKMRFKPGLNMRSEYSGRFLSCF